jgi:transposase
LSKGKNQDLTLLFLAQPCSSELTASILVHSVESFKKTGKMFFWNSNAIILKTYTDLGVYCLRTNQDTWDESTLWRTYTILTDPEAVFRSLKSEFGLRPVFHQKTKRVSSHLFIMIFKYPIRLRRGHH